MKYLFLFVIFPMIVDKNDHPLTYKCSFTTIETLLYFGKFIKYAIEVIWKFK